MILRNIAKVSVPAFHASVIEAKDCSLKKRPFVVSWPEAQRAVVIESSFTAQMEGIKKGMNLKKALRLVPGLVVVPPSPELLKKADHLILDICRRYSPVIEFNGGGQIFVDLGGTEKLWGKALDTASRISKDIRESFSAPLSVGTGSGKTVSHIAASLARPSGMISVNHGNEQDFIFPQPIFLLPGIGHKTATRLSMLGIMNIGELTELSTSDSIRLLGQKGSLIRNTVLGHNDSKTPRTENTLRIRASVINPEDSELLEKAVSTLMKASAQAGFKLRSAELSAEKAELTVLYSDGLVRKLSGISKKELWTDNSIFSFALPLLKRIHSEKRTRIRTISLNLSDLGTGHLQTDLFQHSDNGVFLQSALDSIRSKYGDNAVKNALTMI